jgi:hypothetical protein
MRRGVASLIMGVSLLVASASWAGFVMSRTVLDPGRSERLADHLLDNDEVRRVIVDRMADAMEDQIPAGVPVTRQSLEVAAALTLDDPRVETLVRDGIVQAHQNALNGVDEPVELDATVVGQAGREAVVAQVPQLDLVLPQAPQLEVEVPNAGLSWLGTFKSYVDRYTLLGALAALVGVSAAFVLARNRPAALRRVSFWAFASSAFWIGVGYALPALAGTLVPSSAAIASAAVDVFFGAMIRPALVLAGLGLGLLLASFVWPSYEQRRPAAMLDQEGRTGRGREKGRGRTGVPGYPSSAPRATTGRDPAYPSATTSYPAPDPGYNTTTAYPTADPGHDYGAPYPAGRPGHGAMASEAVAGQVPSPASPPPYPVPAGQDSTQEYPVIVSSNEAETRILAGGGEDPSTSPWVEGVGYIDPTRRADAADTYPAPRFDEAPTVSAPRPRPGR